MKDEKIIKVKGRLRGSSEKMARADIVIVGDRVVKDRHGIAPRPATREELARARKV